MYSDAPWLLLTPQRLRLLQREHERASARWQTFSGAGLGRRCHAGGGLCLGLYYRASGDAAWGKKAVDWALSDDGKDLRQHALVFDWCGPAMTAAQSDRLGAKLEHALAASSSGATALDVRQQSARAFAAIALADRLPDHGESVLKPVVQQWWRGRDHQEARRRCARDSEGSGLRAARTDALGA